MAELAEQMNLRSQLMADRNQARQKAPAGVSDEMVSQYYDENQAEMMAEANAEASLEESDAPAGGSPAEIIKRLAVEKAKQKIKEKIARRFILWVIGVIWGALDFLFNPFNPAGIGMYVDLALALIILLSYLAETDWVDKTRMLLAFPDLAIYIVQLGLR